MSDTDRALMVFAMIGGVFALLFGVAAGVFMADRVASLLHQMTSLLAEIRDRLPPDGEDDQ